MVELIQELKKRGHSVATVKSSSKDIEPPLGKDTQKHWDAGPDMSVFLGPGTTEIMTRKRLEVRDIIDESVDYVLVEGAKSSNIPKFWHIGTDTEVSEMPPNVVAILKRGDSEDTIQDVVVDTEKIPIIKDNNLTRLANIIEETAIPINLIDI
jgi:molybdopterin-guanine dinucleotide biosynthesis protein MobB